MPFTQLLQGTPLWVWALLVFLLTRGIRALSDREIRIERMLLLPLLFLFWGVYGVLHELHRPLTALAAMLVGLLVGLAIGYALGCLQPRLRSGAARGHVVRSGTALTLVLIVLAFVIKYALSAWLALQPELANALQFVLLFGLLGGLIDGVFWGVTLNLFVAWQHSQKPLPVRSAS